MFSLSWILSFSASSSLLAYKFALHLSSFKIKPQCPVFNIRRILLGYSYQQSILDLSSLSSSLLFNPHQYGFHSWYSIEMTLACDFLIDKLNIHISVFNLLPLLAIFATLTIFPEQPFWVPSVVLFSTFFVRSVRAVSVCYHMARVQWEAAFSVLPVLAVFPFLYAIFTPKDPLFLSLCPDFLLCFWSSQPTGLPQVQIPKCSPCPPLPLTCLSISSHFSTPGTSCHPVVYYRNLWTSHSPTSFLLLPSPSSCHLPCNMPISQETVLGQGSWLYSESQ